MTDITKLLKFKLPELDSKVSIVDPEGRPLFPLQRDWETQGRTIEGAIVVLAEALDGLLAAQEAAVAANAAAEVAQDAAAAAQTAADTANDAAAAVGSEGTITASGTEGLTLSATDAGASASIVISAHTRVYGDGTSVAVSGATITGRSYSTDYWVYYDDPTRAGGAVSYQSSTSPTSAVQTGDRHSVGAVTTPAAAAPDNNGREVLPAGVVYP